MGIASVNVIVACAVETRAIGKDGKMPWHLPVDLKYFKERTKDGVVIMGRKTYESIGRALPGRINIVLSSDIKTRDKVNEGVWVVESYHKALSIALSFKDKDIFVIGGGKLYEQAMKGFIKHLYVTWVGYKADGLIEGDTHFPEIDKDRFEMIDEYDYHDEEEYDLTFTTYKPKEYDKMYPPYTRKNGNTETSTK
jgi:dihydrofolate reductase